MWRALWLLLALFIAAPARSLPFADGFEKRMPVSNWVPTLYEGAKDGVLSKTVSSINPSANIGVITSLTAASMVLGDFPTTPYRITGVEIRMSAVASHTGVSITRMSVLSPWYQAPDFLWFSNELSVVSTPFKVGGPSDLPGAELVSFGGFGALMSEFYVDGFLGGTPVGITEGEAADAEQADIRNPYYWLNTVIDQPFTAFDYEKLWEDLQLSVTSADGYDATLYIDSIEFRLHYEDASTAAMEGSGTVAVALQKMKPISAGLSGGGTIAATVNAQRIIEAGMIGTGKIAPVLTRSSGGTIYRYLMPELFGVGSMSLTPLVRYAPVEADMSGAGFVSATVSRGHGVTPSAPVAMSCSGTMAQALTAERPITRALNGTGTITATLVARRPLAAAMSGVGIKTVAMIAQRVAHAAMSGSGTMAVTLQRVLGSTPVAATMNGVGTMTADMIAQRPVAAAISGVGTVGVTGLTTNTRLPAPEGRTFIAPNDMAAFIIPNDFQSFEAQE